MLPIRLVIELNSKLSLLFGGLLNTLLIWLVQAKTPKEMMVYSAILLQVCISDLINLIINDAVQPIVLISNGEVMVVACGLAGKLPYPWNAIVYFFWLYFAYFAMIGIVVQFAYRYMILCRENKHSSLVYFAMVGTTAFIEALLFGSLWLLSYPAPDARVQDPKLLHLLGHDELIGGVNGTTTQLQQQDVPSELRLTLKGESRSALWILWHLCFAAIPIGGYVFVIHAGKLMVKFVDDSLKRASKGVGKRQLKHAELNRQMTLNLMIQACLPLLSIFCWGACAYVCIFGRVMNVEWFNVFSSLTATPVQCWISVFNPLVTILTVMPYRRALLNVFRSRVGTSGAVFTTFGTTASSGEGGGAGGGTGRGAKE